MPSLPKKATKTKTIHEWTIGDESTPTTAKEFGLGITYVLREMKQLGIDLTFDDAYYIRAGDGYEVVFYVEIQDEVTVYG